MYLGYVLSMIRIGLSHPHDYVALYIHTKDARFFCCGNSAADISKPHTFKWDPLADEVLEAA